MFGRKKLSEAEKQAAREAQTESAYTGKIAGRRVCNTLVTSQGETANVWRNTDKPHSIKTLLADETNVKPKRFW